jgi:hypothetical protein
MSRINIWIIIAFLLALFAVTRYLMHERETSLSVPTILPPRRVNPEASGVFHELACRQSFVRWEGLQARALRADSLHLSCNEFRFRYLDGHVLLVLLHGPFEQNENWRRPIYDVAHARCIVADRVHASAGVAAAGLGAGIASRQKNPPASEPGELRGFV